MAARRRTRADQGAGQGTGPGGRADDDELTRHGATHGTTPAPLRGARSLEPAWAVSRYASVADRVDAERLRLPAWASWAAVTVFCSLHIIGPAALGLFACWALLCYRGANVVRFAEHAGAALAADEHGVVPSSLKPLVDRVAVELGSSELYSVGREVVMCPAAPSHFGGAWEDGGGGPAGWLSRHAFDSSGVSIVCRVCERVDPGAVVLAFFGLMALSLLYPSREWPLFARLFETFFDNFSFRFAIDQRRFDPNRRYLLVAVPHGIVPLGSFMATAYIRQYLPGLDARLGVASVLFRLPFLRQFFLWLGCAPASKDALKSVLDKPGGKVAIMSGGVAEIFLSSRSHEQVLLSQRRGFVRLALETGADIVPVYIFGQTQLFDQLATADSALMHLSRRLSASFTLFWGRWWLPVPFPARVSCVVGDPIDVRGVAAGATNDGAVDRVHAAVCAAFARIHAEHRDAAGYKGQELEIL